MLEIKHLSKVYKSKNNEVRALDDINLKIQKTGMIFILGKSGSGKSTLLNVLGGLDQFSEGEIIICGKSSHDFKQSDFDSYRNTFIGFIFQEYNVMDNFTVSENIALALQLQGKKADDKTINDILQEVDLQGLGKRKPNELSGGQLQRVAIARALIKNPEIIMADEPTGALDSRTGMQVFDTLKKLSKDKLVLIVSHDKEFAKNYADRIIELADGKIVSDTSKEHIIPEQINNGISFIENEFINIKDSNKLDDEDIQKIVKKLKSHQGETVISFNQNTNNEIKKTNHIDNQGRLEVFHETTDNHIKMIDYATQAISFIKSKLPFKSSMKIALSNLRLKPFRLLITIILSVISFSLFGFTNTMAEYNKETATYHSMKDSNIDYISINKENLIEYDESYKYYESTNLNSEDINHLKTKYPNIDFTTTFSAGNAGVHLDYYDHIEKTDKMPDSQESLFYPTYFSSLANLSQDMIDKNHFTLLGNLPNNDNEIVVTELFADTFKQFGYQITDSQDKIITSQIINSQDLIGKTIRLNINLKPVEFTICGVLKTNIDLTRFESLKDENADGLSQFYLSQELSTLISSGYHNIGYVSNNRLQDSIDNFHAYSTNNNGNYLDIYFNDNTYSSQFFFNYDNVDKNNLIEFGNEGSFFVNYNIIKNLKINNSTTLEDYIYQHIDDPENKNQTLQVTKEAINQFKDQIINSNISLSLSASEYYDNIIDKVAGVYIDNLNSEEMPFVLKTPLIEQYNLHQDGYAQFIIAPMCDDETLKDIISYTYNDGIDDSNYLLSNPVMPMLSTVNTAIETLQNVFFFIGIGFAIFAAVMFCNFIATSIANKKREIGILRAVGARGLDVLKIFLNESLIIAIVNWLLATSLCFIGTGIINTYIRDEFGVLITVLNFGPIQIILLLIISISVAILASALPVYKISRKKPIDAIKNRK